MERKLEITQCSDGEIVRFTVQQFEGAALDWYENLRGGLDDPEALTFEDFRAAFCDYYVLAGIKKMKKEEFRTLQQDNKTVQQYLTQFTTLARYAPKDIARDTNHQRHFLKGLNSGLKVGLVAHDFSSFQSLVNKTLLLEEECRKFGEDRKHKMSQNVGGPSQRQRGMFPQYSRQIVTPHSRTIQQMPPPNTQTPRPSTPIQPVQ
ncbi:hypothetical protein E2562_024764 [Oryza meyeriana var. granulata]|uniref:Retrotransposon gag domain-containing protein n=1 Tax=Oryza meyeriana var. granulata TaxID=110450 RepID=A0A6G1FBQ2_9ORYZ|nr:hypothetical protein E2562_024764 [Oryza meyeriana var. granulata]